MSSLVKMLQFFHEKDENCYMINGICPSEICEKRLMKILRIIRKTMPSAMCLLTDFTSVMPQTPCWRM